MDKLLRAYWNLCLLRIGPQDLPSSRALLGFTLGAYILIDIIISSAELSIGGAIASSTLDTVILLLFAFVSLWVRELGDRTTQALTALAGCGTLIGIIALPLIFWQHQLGVDSGLVYIPGLIIAGLVIWNIAIVGHIMHHALSTSISIGVALAVFYMLISTSIVRSFFFTAQG